MPQWLRFLAAILAVWRLSHLVAREDGPWDLVARLRERLGEGFWGRLVDCFKCVSVWIAAPFALFVSVDWIERLVVWLALSGGAVLLEQRASEPLILEQGGQDELLRRQAHEELPPRDA